MTPTSEEAPPDKTGKVGGPGSVSQQISQTNICHLLSHTSEKRTEKTKNRNSNKNYQSHNNNNHVTQPSILHFMSKSIPTSTTNQINQPSLEQNKTHCTVNQINGNSNAPQLHLESYTNVTTNKLSVNDINPLRTTTALPFRKYACNKTQSSITRFLSATASQKRMNFTFTPSFKAASPNACESKG